MDLEERNKEIIRLRCEERWTLQAIADLYGITKERVRQLTPMVRKTDHTKARNETIRRNRRRGTSPETLAQWFRLSVGSIKIICAGIPSPPRELPCTGCGRTVRRPSARKVITCHHCRNAAMRSNNRGGKRCADDPRLCKAWLPTPDGEERCRAFRIPGTDYCRWHNPDDVD